mmetsp:Transcript_11924/g.24110  ORF Transcript_11924/g.24110 Transcript_11924/m.24110 type:complete len:411 (+) Transcript_11924:38-1270(+)
MSIDGCIFHERQQSALCGQHCLNNLLQASIFTPGDLAEIAHELDVAERQVMMEMGADTSDALKFLGEDSGNVDESGNFSIQVLNRALERSHEIVLTNLGSESLRGQTSDSMVTQGDAFVLNRSEHWFTVRKLYGRFWNLNSTLSRPEPIGDFYLSAFLTQMQTDGYDVFVASPAKNLPPPPSADPDEGTGYDRGATFYPVASGVLLSSGDGGGQGGVGGKRTMEQSAGAIDPWANAGAGHSMRPQSTQKEFSESKADGDDDDDDDDLALAIAMSMSAENVTAADNTPSAQSAPAADEPSVGPSLELPPEAADDEPAARVLVRGGGLPARFTRRFRPGDPATSVFDWIDGALIATASLGDAAATSVIGYELLLQRTVLTRSDLQISGVTCEGAGLTPSAALTLRPISKPAV